MTDGQRTRAHTLALRPVQYDLADEMPVRGERARKGGLTAARRRHRRWRPASASWSTIMSLKHHRCDPYVGCVGCFLPFVRRVPLWRFQPSQLAGLHSPAFFVGKRAWDHIGLV